MYAYIYIYIYIDIDITHIIMVQDAATGDNMMLASEFPGLKARFQKLHGMRKDVTLYYYRSCDIRVCIYIYI